MKLLKIKSITEYHKIMGLPKPEHPLITLIDLARITHIPLQEPITLVFDFYSMSLKRNFNARMKYGQQNCDFEEGIMFFMAPGQVFSIEFDPNEVSKASGWMILVHPDFLWNTSLAQKIKQYEYFSYTVHEALFLSDKEEATIIHLMQHIGQEYRSNMDQFSPNVIISQLELLLTYAERFYHRQFITRKISNHQILNRLEQLLADYFDKESLPQRGLPTVQFIADALHVSPGYLSGLLKLLTGQSTQQHIHDKLIEKAKERLSVTNLTVSEIAYELGFEHPQSFSKFFKIKTQLSPMAFRQSFN